MKNNNDKNAQLNNLINTLSDRLGSDPEKLKSAAKNGNISELMKNLNSKESEKLQKALSDKDTASKILSSPQAQKLIKNLLGDK